MPSGNAREMITLKYIVPRQPKPPTYKPAMLSARFCGVPKFVKDAIKKGKK